jgi:hypothetical protein
LTCHSGLTRLYASAITAVHLSLLYITVLFQLHKLVYIAHNAMKGWS